MSAQKKQRAKPASTKPTQMDKSNFSRISVDLVVAICQFLDTHGIARLSRCCVLLRSRVSLSLTGAASPALSALRRARFEMSRGSLEPFLMRAQKLHSVHVEAVTTASNRASVHRLLTNTAYPANLTYLSIVTDLQPQCLLGSIASCPALESLRIRFGKLSSDVKAQTTPLKLPNLRSLDMAHDDWWTLNVPVQDSVLALVRSSPALQELRLKHLVLHCDVLFDALKAATLTELSLTHVGELDSDDTTQRSLTPVQSMTQLKKLRLAYGDVGRLQQLAEFPRGLTLLDCSAAVFTPADTADLAFTELKELRLVCHGREDNPALLLDATRAVMKCSPQLQKLAFECDSYQWCRGAHTESDEADVLSMIADGAFPLLELFYVSFISQAGLANERKLAKLRKAIKAKRPAFKFQPVPAREGPLFGFLKW